MSVDAATLGVVFCKSGRPREIVGITDRVLIERRILQLALQATFLASEGVGTLGKLEEVLKGLQVYSKRLENVLERFHVAALKDFPEFGSLLQSLAAQVSYADGVKVTPGRFRHFRALESTQKPEVQQGSEGDAAAGTSITKKRPRIQAPTSEGEVGAGQNRKGVRLVSLSCERCNEPPQFQ